MGWFRFSAPGTDGGPCEGKCEHLDCADTRKQAASACTVCGEAIGYGRPMYFQKKGGLAHASCVQERVWYEKEDASPHPQRLPAHVWRDIFQSPRG